jgi:hypothetical protein
LKEIREMTQLIVTNKECCTKEWIANEWSAHVEFPDQSYIITYIYKIFNANFIMSILSIFFLQEL